MKVILITSLMIYLSTLAFTQSLTPEVIASGGHSFVVNQVGSLQGTIGETVTESLQNEQILSQGFQQVYFTLTTVFERKIPAFFAKIYPNPTVDVVFIATELKEDLDLKLMDLYGRILTQTKIQNGEGKLTLSGLPN